MEGQQPVRSSFRVERRTEARLLCSDLVTLSWRDPAGKSRQEIVNLEDISRSGACLQSEVAVEEKTKVEITMGAITLRGQVRYSRRDELGYFIGVLFESGSRWSKEAYEPKHLFDPRTLVRRQRNGS